MKVVINTCYGGFGLSPQALYELWKAGVTEVGCPVEEFYRSSKDRLESDLKKWREYKKNKREIFALTVFSEDEKYVLWHLNDDLRRDNPKLVEVVERLGEKADGECAKLKVVEIPDGTEWEIGNYDGMEHIAEKHETWY